MHLRGSPTIFKTLKSKVDTAQQDQANFQAHRNVAAATYCGQWALDDQPCEINMFEDAAIMQDEKGIWVMGWLLIEEKEPCPTPAPTSSSPQSHGQPASSN